MMKWLKKMVLRWAEAELVIRCEARREGSGLCVAARNHKGPHFNWKFGREASPRHVWTD